MKKSFVVLLGILMLGMIGCSSSDDDDLLYGDFPEEKPFYASDDYAYNSECNIGYSFYNDIYDPIEKLYTAPHSIEELNGTFFDLGNDYEWRLDSIRDIPEWKGFMRDLEYYSEYYKGVPVYRSRLECVFLSTSQGRWMANFTGAFITIHDLDVNPTLTPAQAMQIFSEYQQASVEPSWKCILYAREYLHKRGNENVGVEYRLIYKVIGPPALHFMDWNLYDMSAHYIAEIDAHTGQIMVAGNDDRIHI